MKSRWKCYWYDAEELREKLCQEYLDSNSDFRIDLAQNSLLSAIQYIWSLFDKIDADRGAFLDKTAQKFYYTVFLKILFTCKSFIKSFSVKSCDDS